MRINLFNKNSLLHRIFLKGHRIIANTTLTCVTVSVATLSQQEKIWRSPSTSALFVVCAVGLTVSCGMLQYISHTAGRQNGSQSKTLPEEGSLREIRWLEGLASLLLESHREGFTGDLVELHSAWSIQYSPRQAHFRLAKQAVASFFPLLGARIFRWVTDLFGQIAG